MTSWHTSGLHSERKRGFTKVIGLFCLLIFVIPDAWSQETLPEFSVDIVSALSDESRAVSRVDVYAQINYPSLSFLNTVNGFSSSYEMSVDAIELSDNDRLRNLVMSRSWDGNIVVDTYAETQSDTHSDFTTQTFDLDPGRYVFEFELIDKNSNQSYLLEFPYSVRSFNAPTTLSDLTLLESYDANTYSVVPLIDNSVSTSDGGLQLFYEVYSDLARDVTVRREIFWSGLGNSIPLASAMIDTEEGSIASEDELTTIPVGKSQHIANVSVEDLKSGSYMVRVSLLGTDGEILDAADKYFIAHWNGLAKHIQDIDNAIQQLEYIAERKDLKFILDAPNQVQRMERFETFWEKRDPTPNTRRNEGMEEYYYRIAAANKQYGAVQDGWRTDRGFVLVRYGEPGFIEKKPHSFDYEPYEVWIYQRIGRQFIFIDKTGFGDFELLVPVWDERTRLY